MLYDPDDDLGAADSPISQAKLCRIVCNEFITHMGLQYIQRVITFCERRVIALEAANGKHGWWRVRLALNPEQILNDQEKCLLLGIKHPTHNPTGQKNKIQAIKRIRVREDFLLRESKELVDAYIVRVENGEAEVPVFPIVVPKEVPDFYALEEELL